MLLAPTSRWDLWGVMAATLSAASMAGGTFLARRWSIGLAPLPLTGWQLLLGGLMFFFLLEKAELYRHGHHHEHQHGGDGNLNDHGGTVADGVGVCAGEPAGVAEEDGPALTSSGFRFDTQTLIGGARLIYMPLHIFQQAIGANNWPFAAAISVIFMVAVLVIVGVLGALGRRSETYARA